MKKWKSDKKSKLLELWRKLYCIIIPIILTTFYLYMFFRFDFRIWESQNFGDTLTSIITFVSIIISFFGVLLTILISAREKSTLIDYFLHTADRQAFVRSLRELIICGLSTVLIAAVLFGHDILHFKVTVGLIVVCIFCLIRFAALTYRFTNILLMLFVGDKKKVEKKEGKTISEEKLKDLDNAVSK